MGGLLEEVELRAKQLMVYDSEVIDIPPKNAERFARISEGNGSGNLWVNCRKGVEGCVCDGIR